MFCSNCGAQIPDNTQFCNHCGARQQTAANAGSAMHQTDAPTQEPRKALKKKANIFVVLAVALCAFLIGKFVIAPSMVSDSDKDKGSQGSQTQESAGNNTSIPAADNPEYEAIFDGTYIVHFQTFFNMDMKSFALKQDDGIICCADYGYEDDTVKQWVETIYIPVSAYTDAQKAEMETTMKTQFASVEALNCCAVTYQMGTNYFRITCTYSNVDQESNYTELYNAGILQSNTFISMSATETTLLSQGFIKK